jgi:predicted amidohydrolase YtcJ
VGNLDEARKLAGDNTEMIDLQRKILLPAFLDGHSHDNSSLTVANQANCYAPPAGPDSDVAGIIASLQKFAKGKNVQPGELIQAYGYDENAMPNGKLLNAEGSYCEICKIQDPYFYTEYTFYFATAHKQNRGLKQASYLSPMRDAIDAGLRPANHTDFDLAPLILHALECCQQDKPGRWRIRR